MGHVNNANHFTYIELARVTYFEEVIAEKFEWSKQGIILAKVVMDYKMPILIRDNVAVYTSVIRFGTKSFEMSNRIVKQTNTGDIDLAIASTVLVCFDYTTNKTIEIPEVWRKKIEEFEK